MSVLLIQGPLRDPSPLHTVTPDLLRELSGKVRAMGSVLNVARCSSAAGLVQCLKQARANEFEVVLVDSGGIDPLDCARHENDLRNALNSLAAPYIEIHDRSDCDLESRVRPRHAASAIIVGTSDLAKGYSIAFGMVLRRFRSRREDASAASGRVLEA